MMSSLLLSVYPIKVPFSSLSVLHTFCGYYVKGLITLDMLYDGPNKKILVTGSSGILLMQNI